MAVTLTLGPVVFDYAEIPERLAFGGQQLLATHQLAGGQRVVDVMGAAEAPLSWSGIFLGPYAESRAQTLNGLRQGGTALDLTWSQNRYQVVIREYTATFMQAYRIPYAISCEVVSDAANPISATTPNTTDMQVRSDLTTANGLASQVNDSATTGLMGTLTSAISAVSDFATATTATLNSVLTPLADVQTRVKVLISSATSTAVNLSTLGGVLPNNAVSRAVTRTASQVASYESLPALYNLQSVLGRMNGNIGLLTPGKGQQVTVIGGDLTKLAAQFYGDPTQWTRIAAANGLLDTKVPGPQTLVIPQ